jgi:hypothetical protein
VEANVGGRKELQWVLSVTVDQADLKQP